MTKIRQVLAQGSAKLASLLRRFASFIDLLFIVLLYPIALTLFVLGVLSLVYSIFVPSEGGLALLLAGALLHFLASIARYLRRLGCSQSLLTEALLENANAFRYIALTQPREVQRENIESTTRPAAPKRGTRVRNHHR